MTGAHSCACTELGATAVEEHGIGNLIWTLMRDPEGNEFCVAQI